MGLSLLEDMMAGVGYGRTRCGTRTSTSEEAIGLNKKCTAQCVNWLEAALGCEVNLNIWSWIRLSESRTDYL
jgi:hypothetical protein